MKRRANVIYSDEELSQEQPPMLAPTSPQLVTVLKKSKKMRVNYIVGIPYTVEFVDARIRDCKEFQFQEDEDGNVTSLALKVPKWENILQEKAKRVAANASLDPESVVATNSPCPAFAVTIADFNFAFECPYGNIKTLETTGTLFHKENPKQGAWTGLQSFCFGCEGCQNGMRGNLMVSPLPLLCPKLNVALHFYNHYSLEF